MKRMHAAHLAGVLALVGGLGMGTALAQAPPPRPVPNGAPAPPRVVAPRVVAPRRSVAVSRQAGTSVGGRHRDWTAGRTLPLAKPWLKAFR
jgi:hypothetical protein